MRMDQVFKTLGLEAKRLRHHVGSRLPSAHSGVIALSHSHTICCSEFEFPRPVVMSHSNDLESLRKELARYKEL